MVFEDYNLYNSSKFSLPFSYFYPLPLTILLNLLFSDIFNLYSFLCLII
jgi:hypothetical protein